MSERSPRRRRRISGDPPPRRSPADEAAEAYAQRHPGRTALADGRSAACLAALMARTLWFEQCMRTWTGDIESERSRLTEVDPLPAWVERYVREVVLAARAEPLFIEGVSLESHARPAHLLRLLADSEDAGGTSSEGLRVRACFEGALARANGALTEASLKSQLAALGVVDADAKCARRLADDLLWQQAKLLDKARWATGRLKALHPTGRRPDYVERFFAFALAGEFMDRGLERPSAEDLADTLLVCGLENHNRAALIKQCRDRTDRLSWFDAPTPRNS